MKIIEARIVVRTQEIIDGFRGMPGEWYMLKGLIVATHVTKSNLSSEYDTILIAKRMDEMTADAKAELSRVVS